MIYVSYEKWLGMVLPAAGVPAAPSTHIAVGEAERLQRHSQQLDTGQVGLADVAGQLFQDVHRTHEMVFVAGSWFVPGQQHLLGRRLDAVVLVVTL